MHEFKYDPIEPSSQFNPNLEGTEISGGMSQGPEVQRPLSNERFSDTKPTLGISSEKQAPYEAPAHNDIRPASDSAARLPNSFDFLKVVNEVAPAGGAEQAKENPEVPKRVPFLQAIVEKLAKPSANEIKTLEPEAPEHPQAQEKEPGAQTQAGNADIPPTDKPPVIPHEADEGGDKPLLPSTLADKKWTYWRGGAILLAHDPEKPGSELVKLYRSADEATEAPNAILTTRAGVSISLRDSDIVQVYQRDRQGNPENEPFAIFQSGFDLPAGFSVKQQMDAEEKEQLEGLRNTVATFAKNPDFRPAFGRSEPSPSGGLKGVLSVLATYIPRPGNGESRASIAMPSGNKNEMLITRPLFGARMALITPGGLLLKGRMHDRVEIAHVGPDGGFEVLQEHRLFNLAQEEGYIRLL